MAIFDRFKRGWNAFLNRDPPRMWPSVGTARWSRPDVYTSSRGVERTIINSINTRIAIDVSAIEILHVKIDENGRYLGTLNSELNNRLRFEANKDQTGRDLIQDAMHIILDEGECAICPVDTDVDPEDTDSAIVYSWRAGTIKTWYPDYVTVDLYNDRTGNHEEVQFAKREVNIIENPFKSVMNEPNSTLKRLVHKLSLLDAIDEESSAGKLDLIIQLPYTIRSDERRRQAEERRQEIVDQLTNSKYGIAYTDGTEHIVQLNRSIENNLLKQIEYLTNLVFSQLSMDMTVLNGTADEKTMLNYQNQTIEPFVSKFVNEFKRKMLSPTARGRGQSIMSFRDPFRLVPISQLADIADKLTRNAVISSNEMRQFIGLKPVQDQRADELSNKNLNQPPEQTNPSTADEEPEYEDQEDPEDEFGHY